MEKILKSLKGFLSNSLGSSVCFVSYDVKYLKYIIEKIISDGDFIRKVDLFHIKPEGGNIKISDVREAQEFLMYKPNSSDKKLVIIEEIDKMSQESANASLKVIEEPANYSIILATTTRWAYLLPTLKSRFFKFNLPFPNDWLKELRQSLTPIEYRNSVFYLKNYFDILLQSKSDPKFIKELLENIEILKKESLEELLKNIVKKVEDARDTFISNQSFFTLFFRMKDFEYKDLIDIINKILKIKSREDNLILLKRLSFLSSVIIHDAFVARLSMNWKRFINPYLIDFFGYEDYDPDYSMMRRSLSYYNQILRTTVSNLNFEMELSVIFLRLYRSFFLKGG